RGALERAGQDPREALPGQARREELRLGLALRGERQIGAPGVLPGKAPRGLAVPDDVQPRKLAAHSPGALSASGLPAGSTCTEGRGRVETRRGLVMVARFEPRRRWHVS